MDGDIDASAVYLARFEVPDANPITRADIDEFIRTIIEPATASAPTDP